VRGELELRRKIGDEKEPELWRKVGREEDVEMGRDVRSGSRRESEQLEVIWSWKEQWRWKWKSELAKKSGRWEGNWEKEFPKKEEKSVAGNEMGIGIASGTEKGNGR
jgi:hypothetical protein